MEGTLARPLEGTRELRMLRFRIHDRTLSQDAALGALGHGLGGEDRAVRGTCIRAGSDLQFQPERAQEAALACLAPVGAMGRMLVQTCILPSRDDAYDFFLEVARHRIKQYIEKTEDWQMWDPSRAGDALERWERARKLFRSASVASVPEDAERSARDAVANGMDAGEALALQHAEIFLRRRYRVHPASSALLGVAIDPTTAQPGGLVAAAARMFDVLAIRVPWRALARGKDRKGKAIYDFTALDQWVAFATKERKQIALGPIVELRGEALPDEVAALATEVDRFRETCWDHACVLAERYQKANIFWNVASGVGSNLLCEMNPTQMSEFVRKLCFALRTHRRDARTMVEIDHPFHERTSNRLGAVTPTGLIERFVSDGVPVNAVGLRFDFVPERLALRDLLMISSELDRYLGRQLPVFISAFGTPSGGDVSQCGSWRGEPSVTTQASWATRFGRVAMSKPFVEGLWWSRLVDTQTAFDGVLDIHGKPKAVLGKLLAWRQSMRTPFGGVAPSAQEAEADGEAEA